MKAKLKNFLSKNKGVFYAFSALFLTMCCICGIYCHSEKDIQNFCQESKSVAMSEPLNLSIIGLKCRQCGRQLEHKGYFCSENCRERYANEYYGERYGKAICRNCGKEFIRKTAYSYCCSPKCDHDYYEDLKMVGEAEEYRKSKKNDRK